MELHGETLGLFTKTKIYNMRNRLYYTAGVMNCGFNNKRKLNLPDITRGVIARLYVE
jgi:hypothetical protein